MHIIISRHGESNYNLENRIGGDPSLSARGHEYGKRLAKYCKDNDVPEHLISSQLVRTRQTVFYSSKNFSTYEICQELNEINAGVAEHLTFEEFKARYPDEHKRRMKDKLNFRYLEGESYIDLIERTRPIIEEIVKTEKDTFIVCHRAVARALLFHLMKIDKKQVPHQEIPLHTILDLTGKPGEMNLVYHEI